MYGHLPTPSPPLPQPAWHPARTCPPPVHTTHCRRCGETSGAAAPSCAQAEGLQGKYLLPSPSAKGAILSAQTLQSSGQEAKVNSEKVFKRPNTHTHWVGVGGSSQGGGDEVEEGLLPPLTASERPCLPRDAGPRAPARARLPRAAAPRTDR